MDDVLGVSTDTLIERLDQVEVGINRLVKEKADAERAVIARARRLAKFYGEVWHGDPCYFDSLLELVAMGADTP